MKRMRKMAVSRDIIIQSCRVADSFLNNNRHLRNVDSYSLYNQRYAGFKDLGITDETGYISFTPMVTMDVESEWQDLLYKAEYDAYVKKIDETTDDWLTAQCLRNLYWQVSNISHKDIIARNVPAGILDYIRNLKKQGHEKGIDVLKKLPTSPKLTKLVAYMFGEKSGGAMDWLTTKCPRENKTGAVEEYRIFVSVLPHHVAGMSYYAAANHGGKDWNGYGGTSCQDPARSRNHDLINHLPASLMENTLAVAWLAKRENADDIFRPVYEARALIRLVPCEYKNLFLICKPYFTDPTVRHILKDGLKNQFPGLMLDAEGIGIYGTELTEIHVELDSVEYEGEEVCDCWRCDGTGNIIETYTHDCETCDGTGYVGEDEEVEECPECEGWGQCEVEEEETCPSCDGEGHHSSYSGEYLPYVDDTSIIAIDEESILYYLPTDLLINMGAIQPELELEYEE
jgi:hypothetical protein